MNYKIILLKTVKSKRKQHSSNNLLKSSLLGGTYTANMLRGLGARPARLHQATPFTGDGCLRLCRQRQPQPEPEAESEEAHSFTNSSLAQVSRIRPLGLHFILVTDSWRRRKMIALL